MEGTSITTDSPTLSPSVIWTMEPDVRPVSTVRVSVEPSAWTVTVEVPSTVATARLGTCRASSTSS